MSRARRSKAGLSRSASLLRALGANAAPVWAELDAEDAAAIAAAMDQAMPHSGTDADAANAALKAAGAQSSVWEKLSALPTDELAALIDTEAPQVIALTLSRIDPEAAAALVRRAPTMLATEVLHRMLHMATPHESAVRAIEQTFAKRLAAGASVAQNRPDETVARILDALPSDAGDPLLDALHKIEPGAGERVRALMFNFEDIASLAPAGMQTLLSRVDRTVLTLALKGAPDNIADTFFRNMTARAREVLLEEIAALGARPRAEVETARTKLVSLTRTLIDAGEILPGGDLSDRDLIA